MKSTIVYIHGYGSSPTSRTATAIKEAFPDEKFVCPHLDHDLEPEHTKKVLDALAKKLADEDDVVIIGSSMGGFWADYMAAVHGFKTVLINPALKPSETMKRFGASPATLAKYAALENLTHRHSRFHVVTFYGSEDKIVPLHHVQTKYKSPRILKGEGHQLSDLGPVFDMVQKMIGNYPEHQ